MERVGDRMVREGRFTGWEACMLLGRDVYAKTLGIVGCGRIGRAIARRASGFGIKTRYHNRKRLDRSVEQKLRIEYSDFDDLLNGSDYIVISVPLTDETRHLFTLTQFKKMKPSAVLVNIGRGPVVKEDDLVEALNSGLIWGGGLDVYEFEPDIAKGLAACPRTTLLPHLGSASTETRTAMANMAIQAVIDTLEGKTPKNQVN
ncbi:MAG: NAD(P)-binding domain-containing protein [Candidatus Mariimomonas ferrooxydans]